MCTTPSVCINAFACRASELHTGCDFLTCPNWGGGGDYCAEDTAWSGDAWTSSLGSADGSYAPAIKCDSLGRITELILPGTKEAETHARVRRRQRGVRTAVTGTLPSTLFTLTRLTKLEMTYHDLRGTLPPNVTALTSLSYFKYTVMALSGTVSTDLLALTALDCLVRKHTPTGS